MTDKTPQEKKRLSYLKDRRNTYGENDKSSRKNIHRSKRRVNQANRRIQRQALASASGLPGSEAVENFDVAAPAKRPKRWSKSPDRPLGTVLVEKLARRAVLGIATRADTEAKIGRIKSHAKVQTSANWAVAEMARSLASSEDEAADGDLDQRQTDHE